MTLQYRLAGRVDTRATTDAHEEVLRVFGAWVAWKRYDASDLSPGRRWVGPNVVLLASHEQPVDGSRTTRFQLRETFESQQARWVTTLTVHTGSLSNVDFADLENDELDDAELPIGDPLDPVDDGPGTWLLLDLERIELAGGIRPAQPSIPKLAKDLLDTVSLLDGDVPMSARPEYVDSMEALEDLVGDLASHRRRLPLVVAAGRLHDTEDSARGLFDPFASNMAGTATVSVISPDLLSTFNAIVGVKLALLGGQVRTFETRPRPKDEDDALRHRLMGMKTILSDPRRAARVLAIAPRKRSLTVALPAALEAIQTQSAVADRQAARDAATAAIEASSRATSEIAAMPASSEDEVAAQFADKIQALTASVGLLSEQLESLTEQIEDEARARTSAEQRVQQLEEERDLEIVEHDATAADLTATRDRARWLEARLTEAGDYEAAHATPDEESTVTPDYVSDLIDVVSEFEGIGWTANASTAGALDEHLKAGMYARRAWEALSAMNDYAEAVRAGDWNRDFFTWCRETPSGRRGLAPKMVVPRESSQTMQRYGALRLFDVPTSVNPNGKAVMEAHIRVGDGSPPAPRMHFYDDASGPTGKVWIGYLGPHLPNTKTSST